ncbi:copper amine oxidase N-terminal domain-containing protein [Paenibacillus kobensis]|uniref:copper amine oxidase N-terminal domain-containing protein n=1 Tax=Paenibacillus kobensis TaxID=59841 RepID=UPI000FD9898B|nr:copper amine oxidase N-terminal domain-containing protein [Paenibacillus kobensis]
MLKGIKRFKRTYLVLLAAVVVIIAGCQAVAGVDLNKMLLNSLKVQSAESKQSVELKLLWDEQALADDEDLSEGGQELISMLSNVKLQINEMKLRDNDHMSVKGDLSLGSRSFGFGMVVDGETSLMTLEGAKQPFLLDMSGASALETLGLGLTDEDGASPVTEQTITEVGRQLIDHVGGYLVGTMPNPEGLSVDPLAQTTVNGESMTLAHVSVKLDAEQMWNWVKDYVGKLQNDREGLRKTMVGLVDIVLADPSLKQAIEASEEGGNIRPTDEEIDEIIDEMIDGLASFSDSMKEQEQADDFAAIVNKNSFAQADLYVDSKLDIRKSSLDLQFKSDRKALASEDEEELPPIEGLSLSIKSEMWNINGDVAVDKVGDDQKKSAVELESLENLQGYEVLRMFDPASDVYSLLDQELHIGRQEVIVGLYSNQPAIITPSGVTLVPLRRVASELGASIKLDLDRIKLNDGATGTSITLKKGSSQATVNGKTVKWSFPTTTIDNAVYVPARDLAKALGASVRWETFDTNEKLWLEITREVH